MSVTLTDVWSGSTLFAQTCLSPSEKSDLGLHCLLRPVCHPDRSLIWVYTVSPDLSVTLMEVWSGSTLFLRPVCHLDRSLIWVYTVCPDLSGTLTEVWSGSTLIAQICLSPWQKSDLGLHCLPRPVCHPDRSLIWVYTVCPDLSVTLIEVWSGSTLFAQTCLCKQVREVWSGSTLFAKTCLWPC